MGSFEGARAPRVRVRAGGRGARLVDKTPLEWAPIKGVC